MDSRAVRCRPVSIRLPRADAAGITPTAPEATKNTESPTSPFSLYPTDFASSLSFLDPRHRIGNRPIGADRVGHEVGQNNLGPVDDHRPEDCVTLIDQV